MCQTIIDEPTVAFNGLCLADTPANSGDLGGSSSPDSGYVTDLIGTETDPIFMVPIVLPSKLLAGHFAALAVGASAAKLPRKRPAVKASPSVRLNFISTLTTLISRAFLFS